MTQTATRRRNGTAPKQGLPAIRANITENGAESKTKGVLEGAKDKLFDDDDDEDESSSSGGNGGGSRRTTRSGSGSQSGSGSGSRSRAKATTRGRS